jgi:eukaryotic-like serine/threonine-protein kinase
MRPLTDVSEGTIIGEYRVSRYIASGQWGSVYAARRLGTGDDVALKLLPSALLTPAQRAEFLDREDRFGRQARHPHLIRTFDAFTLPDGTVALVMELARTDLRRLLETGPADPRILRQLWQALSYMHAAGWVHGDLKPANVLIAADGSVRVGDFGLAAQIEGTHGYTPGLGTQDYLPPEWWDQGLDSRGVITRPATDVWAFGVIAHEVLTGGMHPFPGATPAARAGAIREYAADPGQLRLVPTIPPPWPEIIRDCLRPGHAERLAATRELGARMTEAPAAAGLATRFRRIGFAIAAALSTFLLGASTVPPPAGTEPVATPRPGELRPGGEVPGQYRTVIAEAAHACPKPVVTPALIAGMLKVESNFDAGKRSPQTDEYGIAMWTPTVFAGWAPKHPDRTASVFSADDSIRAMGAFLCYLVDTVGYLPGDQQLLIASAYRVGGKRVRKANGIPPETAAYTSKIKAKTIEYGY